MSTELIIAELKLDLEESLPGFFAQSKFHFDNGQGWLFFKNREDRISSIEFDGGVTADRAPAGVTFRIQMAPKKVLGVTIKRGRLIQDKCSIS
ncbi:hypothetical protein [Shimazuella alba]|uniref:Uncharacterized protein n=1 Tax=Shimazuella alba TaxID=2690964 RepID=A0A6I4VRB9_9BACL|nr:hypothetical protein [Shimazuella alba]MXQ52320.1 hypothetical protein [Shimazuella alba]